mmetsp:Transcript_14295/g.33281  ORF Transcript_14295/g.33281 Transcript_14295/m.33281 type:complete len:99 (-) Transcript_14295:30-326(-)
MIMVCTCVLVTFVALKQHVSIMAKLIRLAPDLMDKTSMQRLYLKFLLKKLHAMSIANSSPTTLRIRQMPLFHLRKKRNSTNACQYRNQIDASCNFFHD